jgi:hypothetical protein
LQHGENLGGPEHLKKPYSTDAPYGKQVLKPKPSKLPPPPFFWAYKNSPKKGGLTMRAKYSRPAPAYYPLLLESAYYPFLLESALWHGLAGATKGSLRGGFAMCYAGGLWLAFFAA